MKHLRLIILVSSCLIVASFLMFHTFSYDQANSSMLIGSKLWSDFSAHIPVIRSFSMGNNWPPEYPIFPGEPIRYHFLFYFLVGMLERIGLRIDWALNIPSIIGFAGLCILIWIIAKGLFHHTAIAVLSLLFFVCNGSLTFFTFFRLHPLNWHTWRDIITNTTFLSFAPWGTGDISAFWTLNIYTNQRHLGLAFALGLLCILILLLIEKKSLKKQLPFLLITVPSLSILPYFHQPMLLIIGIFFACYFIVFPKLRTFIVLTGIGASAPVLLQLQTLTNGAHHIVWKPGYLMTTPLTPFSFLLYWWHNIGLHLFLIPLGFILSPRRIKKIIFPIWILFCIGMCFQFAVEMAANHKFFNFFMLWGNMLSAYTIVISFQWIMQRCKKTILRLIVFLSSCLIVFFLTFSGIIDLFPILNDPQIPLVDIPKNPIATWIATATPPDAVFLNSSYMYHPASLAGRKIFLGWPYFAWSAGYTENRMPIMKTMYESKNPDVFCPILEKYHISYMTVEEVHGNPDLPTIELSYFRSLAEPVYTLNNVYDIYTKDSLCKAKP